MNDFTELEERLEKALVRLEADITALPQQPVAPQNIDGQADLRGVEEKLTKVRVELAHKSELITELKQSLRYLERILGQMKASNADLRAANDALCAAQSQQTLGDKATSSAIAAAKKSIEAEKKMAESYMNAVLDVLDQKGDAADAER